MKATIVLLFGFSLVLLAGCAAFETTPADVQQHLTHPLDGNLYDPNTRENYQMAGWPGASP